MSTRIEATYTNSDLPLLSSLMDQIKAIPGYADWITFDETYASLTPAGLINSLTSHEGETISWDNTTPLRPALVPQILREYSVGDFAKQSRLTAASPIVTLTGAISFALMFKPRSDPWQYTSYLNWFASSSDQLQLTKNGGDESAMLRFVNGAQVAELPNLVPCDGEWHTVIGSRSGQTIRASVDGGSVQTAATASTAGNPTGNLTIGGLPGGFSDWRATFQAAEIILFDSEIVATAAYRTLINKYASRVHGI